MTPSTSARLVRILGLLMMLLVGALLGSHLARGDWFAAVMIVLFGIAGLVTARRRAR